RQELRVLPPVLPDRRGQRDLCSRRGRGVRERLVRRVLPQCSSHVAGLPREDRNHPTAHEPCAQRRRGDHGTYRRRSTRMRSIITCTTIAAVSLMLSGAALAAGTTRTTVGATRTAQPTTLGPKSTGQPNQSCG